MIDKTKPNKFNYIFLWLACIIGSWSILPYVYYLEILPAQIELTNLFLIFTLQSSVLLGFICLLSYFLVPRTDLSPFSTKNFLRKLAIPGVILGTAVGLITVFFDRVVFSSSISLKALPPLWARLLASIYGAVNEEVLCRLFLFTLIYFLLRKIFKIGDSKRLYLLWSANFIVALLFGMGHLPALFRLVDPSFIEIFRVLFLNAIPGLVFGWLYWTRGIYCAIISHFTADLMIHVFFAG